MEKEKRNPMLHNLKILPEYFTSVISGRKTAELRKLDRDFQVGDVIILNEFDGENFTGRTVRILITQIYVGEYVAPGYCMLSFQREAHGARVPIETWEGLFEHFCEVQRELRLLKGENA